MYVLDYLIYHLRPYGIINYQQPLPKKLTLKEVFETLDDDSGGDSGDSKSLTHTADVKDTKELEKTKS
jgi:hypothetical protein